MPSTEKPRNLPRISIRIYVFFFLLILTALAVYHYGVVDVLHQVLTATVTASILDLVLRFIKIRLWVFPTSALISGLIVGLIMVKGQVWYIPMLAAIIAMTSKHVIALKRRNIFNPAALSVLIVSFMFPREFYLDHWNYLDHATLDFAHLYLQLNNWSTLLWGGHCGVGFVSSLAVIPLGLFVVYKIKRFELVSSFLTTYLLLFTGYVLLIGQDTLLRLTLEVFGAGAGLLFFTFFMLTDPPTSPIHHRGRLIFGVLTATVAFVMRFIVSPIHFLLLTLTLTNLAVGLINKKTKPIRKKPLNM